jgi:hypothetical protein
MVIFQAKEVCEQKHLGKNDIEQYTYEETSHPPKKKVCTDYLNSHRTNDIISY